MSSSSHNSFSFNEEFEQAMDDEFERCIEECLDDCSEVLEPKKRKEKRAYIERGHEEGNIRLFNDYFSENAIYPDSIFRRRFRMNRPLFTRIVSKLSSGLRYFQQVPYATGRLGLTGLQKCTAAIRMMAYGSAADAVDEYLRIGESTALKCLHQFVNGIIDFYEEDYLRRPTPEDLKRLLIIGASRGFPGSIGSIDCMHWEWKNCPTAWKGQYSRGHQKPTIVLEAVASYDLWIWHAFFGPPGTLNDINVLHRSPVFDDILEGRAPKVSYSVNGHRYKMAYYLTDGIYPNWATFIQSIARPDEPKACLFADRQEHVRKEVERAFGVLQARFAIVRNPSLTMDKKKIGNIMKACIILHNMIIEDERSTRTQYNEEEFRQGGEDSSGYAEVHFSASDDVPTNVLNIMANRADIRDEEIHHQLKADLVEHIWNKFGSYHVFICLSSFI